MHDAALRTSALTLFDAGLGATEVARRLGGPRATARDWRRPRYVAEPRGACWRCWHPARRVLFAPADYAELLGLYLGDGHITELARTHRLRIFLDSTHVNVVDEAHALLARCFPANRIGRHLAQGGCMVVLHVYNGHLACLFPQHGPGKKHERPILLEPWQDVIVAAEPWAFLRGLIRSDGCVFVNRTGRYEYVSYAFKNSSADIRRLFAETCASASVDCRISGDRIAIYRRASVALMLEHVGVKS